MQNFHVLLLSRDGFLVSEHAVLCDAPEIGRHVADLAERAEDGTRLHVID
jgi:hypothetical protein